MNRRPFFRKVMYLLFLAVLLVPLSMLSMPAHKGGGEAVGGGYLARLRDREKLSQANLGEIDPTGAAVKLATLGMQPIAVYALQSKAVEARLKEDWTVLRATLDQITKLQPNFVPAWQFQGWNLSYNISAEFDDYRDRYFWVMEGTRYLQQGTRYNETSPRLLKDVGWVVSHKIGRADEHKQFRRLFVQDSDYQKHDADMLGIPVRTVERRDNWLVGRDWYLKAQEVFETYGNLGGMSELLFYEHAPRCRISYAEALEDDGVFEERAQVAWQTAFVDWKKLGEIQSPTYIEGLLIRLSELDALQARAKEMRKKLDELPPGKLRETIAAEKREKLAPPQRRAIDTPVEKRNEEEHRLAGAASMQTEVTHDEVAARVDPARRDEARTLANELTRLEEQIRLTESSRTTVNYAFWLARCEMETQPETLEARRLIAQGEAAYAEGKLEEAQAAYEAGFKKWQPAVEKFPIVFKDSAFGDGVMDFINHYRTMLERADVPFPENFPLKQVVEWHRKQ